MPVLLTVEAQLSLHERNIAKEPQKHRKPVANYEPVAEIRNCNGVTVQYSVSRMRAS